MASGKTIELTLGHPAPLMNQWTRWHWSRKKKYMKQVAMELHIQLRQLKWKGPAMKRCTVLITRASTGQPDWDGLFACAKAPLDCLVVASKRNPHGLGVIVDDNMACIQSLEIRPEHVRKGDRQETRILIQEIFDD